jgi:hypothetical protein
MGIFRPLGLALVLAIGFEMVLGFAVGYVSLVVMQRGDFIRERLMIRADGTPVINRSAESVGGMPVRTYYFLDRSEAPHPIYAEVWPECALLDMPGEVKAGLSSRENACIGRFSDARADTPKYWYFVHDAARDGRGYFVGYDGESRRRAGYIGRDGLRPDRPPVEQCFPVDGVTAFSPPAFTNRSLYVQRSYSNDDIYPMWRVDMICGGQLLEVDLRSGSVATIMEAADLRSMETLVTFTRSTAAGDDTPSYHAHAHLAVRTSDRFLIFDAPRTPPTAFLLPEELRDQRQISVYELDAKTVLVQTHRHLHENGEVDELTWIDVSGKVVRRESVPLEISRRFAEPVWTALAIPIPLLLDILFTVVGPLSRVAFGESPNYAAALAYDLAESWPVLLFVTLLSAALAWYCFRRQRRYCQRFNGVWLAFVFLLGLPGLVGYLFHRRWPVLEKCPACGQVVPRDRDACAKCGAAFPPPDPKGCEVFA